MQSGPVTSDDSRSVDGGRIFAWYLDRVEDVFGNAVTFGYMKDASQVYLETVEYTSNVLVAPILTADKRIEFVYSPGDRFDIISSFRSGWLVETKKRLEEVLVKVDNETVWKYELGYDQSVDTSRLLLTTVTVRDAEGKPLPAKTFTYQTVE